MPSARSTRPSMRRSTPRSARCANSTRPSGRRRCASRPRRAWSASASACRCARSACTCRRAPHRCPRPPSCWPCPPPSPAVPQRVMCTASEPATARPIPPCWSRRARRASSAYSRWAAHRPSPPWPTAPPRYPNATSCSGPGNAWVTAAKLLVAGDPAGAAADLPAGVTEVMVIADEHARAEFVAADLLAQAEHGADAQAMLVTTSRAARRSRSSAQCGAQARALSRAGHPRVVDRARCGSSIGRFPRCRARHRERLRARASAARGARAARAGSPKVSAAGAVFLGSWSPESMGDYCSGPNHTLPTYGYAQGVQRPVAGGFSEAHHRAGALAGGASGARRHGADPGAPRGAGRACRGGRRPHRPRSRSLAHEPGARARAAGDRRHSRPIRMRRGCRR